MWLINSPIGRKVVMSLTGICLILFLTFHCCMNVAAFFSGHAYNMVCEFLGSNWYAVLGTLGLAFLAVCHIVYAFILTAQNRRARGPQRYEVTSRRPEVSWASQNMLVLGLIIVVGLLLHLYNFWAHMMLAELAGCATTPPIALAGFRRHSPTLSTLCSISCGSWPCGSTSLMASGQQCRPWAGAARFG